MDTGRLSGEVISPLDDTTTGKPFFDLLEFSGTEAGRGWRCPPTDTSSAIPTPPLSLLESRSCRYGGPFTARWAGHGKFVMMAVRGLGLGPGEDRAPRGRGGAGHR